MPIRKNSEFPTNTLNPWVLGMMHSNLWKTKATDPENYTQENSLRFRKRPKFALERHSKTVILSHPNTAILENSASCCGDPNLKINFWLLHNCNLVVFFMNCDINIWFFSDFKQPLWKCTHIHSQGLGYYAQSLNRYKPCEVPALKLVCEQEFQP